jgi:pyruvate/2-oxoglutarate dehydrogenase complex dihydrolipoamide dehydrogenase (E3) component
MSDCCDINFLTQFDVVVIEASTAGLTSCLQAISVGATVALVEKEHM